MSPKMHNKHAFSPGCQSSVVCVMCSRLLCPYLVCFMSLWVKYVPAVFVSLCVNYPVYISPVLWVWFRLVYSLLPGVSVHVSLALSCPALFVKIKDYYLSLYPRLRVPVPPSCVHRDRRPELTVSGAHLPRFVFRFQKSFVCSCLFVPRQGSHRSSSRHSPLQVGVGVRRDRRECRESTGREPSCPPIAGDICRRLWLSQARRRVA